MPGTVFQECLGRNLEVVYYMQILGSQVWPQRSTVRHSPREIISTMCKTEQDTLRKRKPCENYSSILATNQKCINGVFKASLFEWKLIFFKILQVKNIPTLHYKRAYFRRGWAQAMRPQSNLLQFMLKVAFN